MSKTPENATIYFHVDGYDPNSKELNGRRVAGESFLRGFIEHFGGDTLYAAVDLANQGKGFDEFARRCGFNGPVHVGQLDLPNSFEEAPVLNMPGPNLGPQAWRRRMMGGKPYSICGVTHTTASLRIMDGMYENRTAPVEEWDGVICTSKAVKSSMGALLDEADAQLKDRFGKLPPRLQLPVIPLGIHCKDFTHDAHRRANWRAQLNIPDEDILVMTMSRLNAFAKFDPLPMYQALEIAAQKTDQKVHFAAVGPLPDNVSTRVFVNGAKVLCPSVRFHHVDGTKVEDPKGLWSAADIFALPVDNIQETFGLAPVEAMAAGLPMVISDWDGFRDTVTPECGFRTPTYGPTIGSLRREAYRHYAESDNYAQYICQTALQTVLDVPIMAEQFEALFNNPDLRKKMGAAGEKRANTEYDWSTVIPQYQEFWAELNNIRDAKARGDQGEGKIAIAMDPSELFATYASSEIDLKDKTFCAVATGDAQKTMDNFFRLHEFQALKRSPVSNKNAAGVLKMVQSNPDCNLEALLKDIKQGQEPALIRAMTFLLKFHFIESKPV